MLRHSSEEIISYQSQAFHLDINWFAHKGMQVNPEMFHPMIISLDDKCAQILTLNESTDGVSGVT